MFVLGCSRLFQPLVCDSHCMQSRLASYILLLIGQSPGHLCTDATWFLLACVATSQPHLSSPNDMSMSLLQILVKWMSEIISRTLLAYSLMSSRRQAMVTLLLNLYPYLLLSWLRGFRHVQNSSRDNASLWYITHDGDFCLGVGVHCDLSQSHWFLMNVISIL